MFNYVWTFITELRVLRKQYKYMVTGKFDNTERWLGCNGENEVLFIDYKRLNNKKAVRFCYKCDTS